MKNTVRHIVWEVVQDVVQSINGLGAATEIPDDILGIMLAVNPKLMGVVEPGDFTEEQLIGLTFNFKL